MESTSINLEFEAYRFAAALGVENPEHAVMDNGAHRIMGESDGVKVRLFADLDGDGEPMAHVDFIALEGKSEEDWLLFKGTILEPERNFIGLEPRNYHHERRMLQAACRLGYDMDALEERWGTISFNERVYWMSGMPAEYRKGGAV